MIKVLRPSFTIFSIFACSFVFGQNVYISFKSDTSSNARNCDVYFTKLKTGVRMVTIKVPTNGFYGFTCPLEKSFEIVLDGWPDGKLLDIISANCGDSIIVNLDNKTFSYLKSK